MPAEELRITVGDATDLAYLVETPVLKATLTATVSAWRVDGGTERLLHSNRLVLDRHRERMAFAEAAGTDPNDLDAVRRKVIEYLTAEPDADAPTPIPPLAPDHLEAGLALLDAPDLLEQFGQAVQQRGYAGDLARPKLLYLVLCTRGLERPTNVLIEGPSSAGKSHLVNTVTAFFPDSVYYEIAGASPRALVYGEESLEHRFLIIGEADGMHAEGIGASLIRGLVWGNKLRYETVDSTAEGIKPRTIEKAGPTGLITTGTRGLEAELATRMLAVAIPDDPDTTAQIMRATAAQMNGHLPDPVDFAPWHAAQAWLDQHGSWAVTIPFGERLAQAYPNHLVRARRDFRQLLELIGASAVLHQRQRGRDRSGRIIADRRDYELVYHLAGKTFGVINAGGVTPAVRKVVAAITTLVAENSGELVSQVQVAAKLGLDKSVVSRHIRAAIKAGTVVNEESRRGHPMKLRPGDPLPDEKPALPDPDDLFSDVDPLESTATLQHLPQNPHDDADSRSCMGGCMGVAAIQDTQPLNLLDELGTATPLPNATPHATPDFGVTAGETGEELQSCTVAGGVPDPCAADHVCLDCGMPIAAGSYCAAHGGDRGEDHAPILDEPAWLADCPAPVEPDDFDESDDPGQGAAAVFLPLPVCASRDLCAVSGQCILPGQCRHDLWNAGRKTA